MPPTPPVAVAVVAAVPVAVAIVAEAPVTVAAPPAPPEPLVPTLPPAPPVAVVAAEVDVEAAPLIATEAVAVPPLAPYPWSCRRRPRHARCCCH